MKACAGAAPRLLLATAAGLALAACAGGRNAATTATLVDPGVLQPGATITAAAQLPGTPTSPWWKTYGDPQLDALVTSAIATAPSMQSAAARIARAAAVFRGAEADRGPDVGLSAQATGEYFPDHYVYPPPYAGNFGSEGQLVGEAHYRLDFWGRRRQLAQAAEARVGAARAEADDAALLLTTALVAAYVQLDAAYRLHDIAAAGLERREGVVDLLKIRARAGLATDIDAVAAREAVTSTRSEIARLDGEIARRRHEIAALAGRDPAFADRLARPSLADAGDPAPVSAIPAELLGHRPDVRALRASVEAAARETGAARAAFYPDVDLVGFAGLRSISLDQLLRSGSLAAGIGSAISLPIFDSGRLQSNLKPRNAEYDEAVGAYNAAVAAALQQVADAIATLQAERNRKVAADEATGHWTHVVALERTRERQGLSGAADRLASETALLLSQRSAAEAGAGVAIARISLVRALGGAWAPAAPQPRKPDAP